MKLVYFRTDGPSGADSGWRRGVAARGLPYRQAWVAHGGRTSEQWPEMGFSAAARAPSPRPAAKRAGRGAYILQQDPGGRWFVDPWGSNNAGAIRPASPVPPRSAAAADDTCFIIELERATCY